MKTRSLKWQTAFLSFALLLLSNNALALDIYVDPVLTAAVVAQTKAMEKVHEDQNDKLTKIEAANIVITTQLHKLHNLEDSIYKYLSNAQAFVNNLYDIKKIIELSTIEIPHNISRCIDAVPGHLEGVAITAVLNKNVTNTALEITSLVSFLETLCATGGYVDGVGSDKKFEKVNLLNSSQRYFIINKILGTLESINWRFKMLRTQFLIYNWKNLFQELDPHSWEFYIGARYIAEDVILRIHHLI